ncbi:hypothetical protein NSPZN2_40459 [Nitrospira defluvii]|uniref:Transposase n=1 Tax=Nitrospira defluvii TaxID=330214 RepID=A0ABN7LYI0_9BACT|nr:hypothetical protein NSPZN2_40459 [Nitrospira defluvii]
MFHAVRVVDDAGVHQRLIFSLDASAGRADRRGVVRDDQERVVKSNGKPMSIHTKGL